MPAMGRERLVKAPVMWIWRELAKVVTVALGFAEGGCMTGLVETWPLLSGSDGGGGPVPLGYHHVEGEHAFSGI
ncbi:hypothetical protein NDU88_006456 [Pleurodeles waltl]|uniref:Secreted protein n=1 Tax=Pleurodeles waltl TaxID=8319 RepID=A0AAV7PJS7_PLEWA|nr:hypothetical protein NDU88_006456 [Pleurodeles waltl]